MATQRINLDTARIPSNSEVLSGRDCGIDSRRKFNLDRIDKSSDSVTVVIPDDVISMNTSFFLGLFGPSVRRLGKTGFLAKYHFQCHDIHRSTIEEGIERALKETTIFPEKKTAA